jgi:hypothetical protein
MRQLAHPAPDRSSDDRKISQSGTPKHDPALQARSRLLDAADIIGLQRTVGNAATARILREPFPARGRDREGWDQKTEERRDDRAPARRGDRRGDPTAAFETDWAGRALLSHYLYGDGEEVIIRDNAEWTKYMTDSDRLRKQCLDTVIGMAADLLLGGKLGRQGSLRRFHAEIENGEGMVGYQYLHGTNKTVGDFEIFGYGTVSDLKQPGVAVVPGDNPYAPDVAGHGAGKMVEFDLTFIWNDMIDPNGKYPSDIVKSWFAEMISLGEAESYQISIGWKSKITLIQEPHQHMKILGGYPSD